MEVDEVETSVLPWAKAVKEKLDHDKEIHDMIHNLKSKPYHEHHLHHEPLRRKLEEKMDMKKLSDGISQWFKKIGEVFSKIFDTIPDNI